MSVIRVSRHIDTHTHTHTHNCWLLQSNFIKHEPHVSDSFLLQEQTMSAKFVVLSLFLITNRMPISAIT